MRFVKQEIMDYTSAEVVESTTVWSATTLTAGSFTIGKTYTIISIGTTNFIAIGASANTVGVVFTATGVGSGTGTAQVTYNIGDTVLYGNYIWKNTYTANKGNEPSDTSTKWVKWAVSNKYSLIDLRSSTKTIVPTDFTLTYSRGLMDTLIIGNFTAESILIENINNDGTVVYNTQTFYQSPNQLVYDWWSYLYSGYTIETDRGIFFDLPPLGTKIRVTFTKGTFDNIEVGFMVGGFSTSMGKTLEGVKLGFTSYSTTDIDNFGILKITKRSAQDLVDFETLIESERLMSVRRLAKQNRDEIVGFIVDENVGSKYENIVTLGVMQDIQPIATNYDKTTITWSILESI